MSESAATDEALVYGSPEHAASEALAVKGDHGWVTDHIDSIARTVIAGLRERGFTVTREPRCECGWTGAGNHYHDTRMGRANG